MTANIPSILDSFQEIFILDLPFAVYGLVERIGLNDNDNWAKQKLDNILNYDDVNTRNEVRNMILLLAHEDNYTAIQILGDIAGESGEPGEPGEPENWPRNQIIQHMDENDWARDIVHAYVDMGQPWAITAWNNYSNRNPPKNQIKDLQPIPDSPPKKQYDINANKNMCSTWYDF